MSNKIFKNKKAIAPAIGILLLIIIILLLTCLTYFLTKKSSMYQNVLIPNSIDGLYLSQIELDNNINNIFILSTNDFTEDLGKTEFINRFKKNLKAAEPFFINSHYSSEYNFILNQLNENRVDLSNEKISLTLDLFTENKVKIEGKEVISLNYTYTKTFEKFNKKGF